jgi:MFS family permease
MAYAPTNDHDDHKADTTRGTVMLTNESVAPLAPSASATTESKELCEYGGVTRTLVLAAVAGSLGSFAFGYNLGSLNAVLERLEQCPRRLPSLWSAPLDWRCFQVSKSRLGLASSLLCLGALLGCLLGGKPLGKFGRKPTILGASLLFLVGLLLLCFALNVPMLYAGRLIVGLGIGVTCVAAPVYLSEIGPVRLRGIIGSMHQMMIVIGYLVSMLLGLLLMAFDVEDRWYASWRVVLGLNLLTILLQFVLMAWSPESPVHLATPSSNGDDQEGVGGKSGAANGGALEERKRRARAALQWLRRDTYDERELQALFPAQDDGKQTSPKGNSINQDHRSDADNHANHANYAGNHDSHATPGNSPRTSGLAKRLRRLGLVQVLFVRRDLGRSLLAVVLLHLAQQLSCINGILYFSTQIFAVSANGSPQSFVTYVPLTIAIVNVAMTVLSLVLMERAGRKPLLIGSCLAMAAALALYTGAAVFLNAAGPYALPAKAVAIFAFIGAFAVGMGPVPWLMMSEIFDADSVSTGVTLGVSVNWLSNFAVVALFPVLVDTLKAYVFVPFLACIIAFMFYAIVCLRETKGRPAKPL